MESVSIQGLANVLGLEKIDDIFSIPFKELKAKQQVRLCPACAALDTRLVSPYSVEARAPAV